MEGREGGRESVFGLLLPYLIVLRIVCCGLSTVWSEGAKDIGLVCFRFDGEEVKM